MESFATILISTSLILFLGVVLYGMMVWRRRNGYMRERFALLALFAILTLTVMLLASFATSLMPWNAISSLFQVISAVPHDRASNNTATSCMGWA